MSKRKHDFSEDDKVRVLLWCARHCCLCGRMAGVGIEVAHIDSKLSDIDNAIPLCFDCHASVGHYNAKHPRGRKYGAKELKARRDQIYEENTRHLVPPVEFRLSQKGRDLPDVGFVIANAGVYPVRASVKLCFTQGGATLGSPLHANYDGRARWNLNAGFVVSGHFNLMPSAKIDLGAPQVRARIDVVLFDIYARHHRLLPVWNVLPLVKDGEWYFEPSEEESEGI